jgi:hypothetical protein
VADHLATGAHHTTRSQELFALVGGYGVPYLIDVVQLLGEIADSWVGAEHEAQSSRTLVVMHLRVAQNMVKILP